MHKLKVEKWGENIHSWAGGCKGITDISVSGSKESCHRSLQSNLLPVSIMHHGSGDKKWGSVVMKRERRGMFKQSYALEAASQAAQWSHTLNCFCYVIYLFGKKKLARGKKKQKNIGEFKIGERFNPQNIHKRTQTHRQGLGQRSNGPELSPFWPRTSEVPLCAALHLFYPSSLIRPGWPRDPEARVTCQLTVYSWARGLTLCQHLFCERGGRKKKKKTKKRGVWFSEVKTKQQTEKVRVSQKEGICFILRSWIKIYPSFIPTLINSDFRWCSAPTSYTDDTHVW